MRQAIMAALLLAALPAAADPVRMAGSYRTCAPEASEQGRGVVAEACGTLAVPDFTGVEFQSAKELEAGRILRDAFLRDVETYGTCVSELITSRLQHEGPDDGYDADKAACAHSWAEDEATETVRGFGKACIDFANRSVMDIRLTPYEGACYPATDDSAG